MGETMGLKLGDGAECMKGSPKEAKPRIVSKRSRGKVVKCGVMVVLTLSE